MPREGAGHPPPPPPQVAHHAPQPAPAAGSVDIHNVWQSVFPGATAPAQAWSDLFVQYYPLEDAKTNAYNESSYSTWAVDNLVSMLVQTAHKMGTNHVLDRVLRNPRFTDLLEHEARIAYQRLQEQPDIPQPDIPESEQK